MKLQKLVIHNIASIEDAEINFDKSPLDESEVFLITGKTGSGKSTILDAICLALYASTPRMENTAMQGKTFESGDKEVKINDPRQLLRRNMAEGAVTLYFIGSNGIKYKACWSVARAHNKVSGALQAKHWQLENLDSQVVLTKDKDITSEIQSAIGLDFKQFCRTTMLAQGEFSKFLNSKDDEKADILEKITGVDIYSRIGIKIFNIEKDKKSAFEKARENINNIIVLSDEQLAQKHQEISDIQSKIEQLRTQKNVIEQKSNWLTKEISLNDELQQAQKEYSNIKLKIESSDFGAENEVIADWSSSTELRNWINEINNNSLKQQELRQRLNNLQNTYLSYRSSELYKVRELEKTKSELKSIDDFLIAQQSKKEIYNNAQSIVGQLNTIISTNKRIADLKKIIAEKSEQLNGELTTKLRASTEKLNNATSALDKSKIALRDAINKLNDFKLPVIRKEKEDNILKINNITLAIDKINSLEKEKARFEKNKKELDETAANIKNLTKQQTELSTQLHDAQLKRDTCQNLYDSQHSSLEDWAKDIRRKLKIGDFCPVCMQKISSKIPHEDDIVQLIAPTEKAINEAITQFNDIQDKLNKISAQISVEIAQYQKNKQAFNNDNSLNELLNETKEICLKCGIQAFDSQTLETLNEQLSTFQKRNLDLNAEISKGEILENEVNACHKASSAAQDDSEKAKEVFEADSNNYKNCQTDIKTNTKIINEKEKEISENEQEISQTITADSPWSSWRNNPQNFISELQEAVKLYNKNLLKQTDLQKKYSEEDGQIKNECNAFKALLKVMPEWESLKTQVGSENNNILEDVNSLRAETTSIKNQISTLQEQIDNSRRNVQTFISNNKQFTNEYIQKLNTYDKSKIDQLCQSHEETRRKESAAKSLLSDKQRQFTEHQTNRPNMTTDDTLASLATHRAQLETEISQSNEHCGAIRHEIELDAQNKKNLSQKLTEIEQLRLECQKWNRLNQYFGDATGAKFRKIAQSYVLEGLIHSANGYLASLTDRYTLKIVPGSFVIMMCDAYQGYSERAATTISGGESFLVSLALALALSDIGQKLAVDTLFIDEGFGTLSGEHLYKAVETLRTLHSRSGRHVGIISHVEELKEQIPVQLRVESQTNNSCSKIRIACA